jgi:uncharacterized protein involved in oxidation of intracellular sulfur
MNVLLILNDAPYGTERSYNGLRLAPRARRGRGHDGPCLPDGRRRRCAKRGQTTPEGFYNIGRMLKGLTTNGVEVGTCGSCMDARGITDADLGRGHLSLVEAQLAEWTLAADKVVTF